MGNDIHVRCKEIQDKIGKSNCHCVCFRSREDWLNARVGFICASETANLIGCGFNDNIWLWKKKTRRLPAYEPPKNQSTERLMELGSKSEQHIRETFALDHGVKVIDGSGILIINRNITDFKDDPFMACTLDGLGIDKDGDPFIVEIKRSENGRLFGDEPPPKYRAQVLKQMLVTGLNKAVLVVRIVWYDHNTVRHVTEKEYWFYRCNEDVAYDIECIRKIETEFWNENVLKDIEPPLMLPTV